MQRPKRQKNARYAKICREFERKKKFQKIKAANCVVKFFELNYS